MRLVMMMATLKMAIGDVGIWCTAAMPDVAIGISEFAVCVFEVGARTPEFAACASGFWDVPNRTSHHRAQGTRRYARACAWNVFWCCGCARAWFKCACSRFGCFLNVGLLFNLDAQSGCL